MKENVLDYLSNDGQVDLHCHLGSSVSRSQLFQMARKNGIKLPTKDYQKFLEIMDTPKHIGHEEYLQKFHITQRIQSSPDAIEESIFLAITEAYTRSNVTLIEIRFNPMFRNLNKHFTLDSIMLSACIGLQKAINIYPVKAGLIIESDRGRGQTIEDAFILLNKSIKYSSMGVVGIDVSGSNYESKFDISDYYDVYKKASEIGLGTTIHAGELPEYEYEIESVLKFGTLKRIGHGIQCYKNTELMSEIKRQNIVLEICPTSNLVTGCIKDSKELILILETLSKNNVKFCINTDGPVFLKTSVKQELDLIRSIDVFNDEEIENIKSEGFKATFIK